VNGREKKGIEEKRNIYHDPARSFRGPSPTKGLIKTRNTGDGDLSLSPSNLFTDPIPEPKDKKGE